MAGMVPVHMIERVRGLLRMGMKQRAIARRLAGLISRSSINNIARRKGRFRLADAPPLIDREPEEPRPDTRCPTCGRRIALPCLPCLLESGGFSRATAGAIAEELAAAGLQLEKPEADRYGEVRAWREAHDGAVPPDGTWPDAIESSGVTPPAPPGSRVLFPPPAG
jgi:hypothetical protein